MKALLLGRYDANAVSARFADVGIYTALQAKGFDRFQVTVEHPTVGLPHTRLLASKQGKQVLLLDASITEVAMPPEFFREHGFVIDRPLEFVSLYWLREQDPTAEFSADRPALPLQEHPGLGILRRAFHIIVQMARELDKDGVSCMPKFFHDAVIFFRSRLLLFLDAQQQGRFEALVRDLSVVSLATASVLLASNGVRDHLGRIARWEFTPQVLPLSATLCSYFNSPQYAEDVSATFATSHFTIGSDTAQSYPVPTC